MSSLLHHALKPRVGLISAFLTLFIFVQAALVSALTIQIPPLYGKYQGTKFSTGPISINGTKWQVVNLQIQKEGTIFTIPKILALSTKVGLEAWGSLVIKEDPPLKDLKVPWKAIINKEQGAGKLTAYPTLDGLGLEFVLKWPGRPGFEWEAGIRPVSKTFSWSKGMDVAVEQLKVDSQFNLLGSSWDFKEVTGTLFLKILKGQALYAPWFIDFTKYPFDLQASCLARWPEVILNELRLNWIVNSHISELKITNFEFLKHKVDFGEFFKDISWKNFSLEGRLEDIYTVFVKEPFSDMEPLLAKLDIKGWGSAEIEKNRIDIKLSSSIFWRKTPVLERLKIHAPVPLFQNNCFDGAVSWKKAFIPGMPELYSEPVRIPLKVCRKSAELGPVEVRFNPEGLFSFQRIYIDFNKPLAYATHLTVPDVRLEKLFPSLPWKGVLKASFERISFRKGRFDFSGLVEISLGSGTITISNMWLEPSGTLPRWGADIAFTGLELADLTKQTSFGYMTGTIRGHIKGLVMSGVEPEAFDMIVETDPKGRGRKKISAEAVESLSIIGGGAGLPFIGRFFKNYSYSKIGIHCTLKNDIFTLHGLIKKGDTEYLVKRGFPFGVDVINRNPEGKISFRDMLERLKRIGSQEETAKE